MYAEYGNLRLVDYLLGVGAEEYLRNEAVLLGVYDNEVGFYAFGIVYHCVAVVRVGLKFHVVGDVLLVEEVHALA